MVTTILKLCQFARHWETWEYMLYTFIQKA